MVQIEIELAQPPDYASIDKLIQDSYRHDYGHYDHGLQPSRFAAYRAQYSDVWVARQVGTAEIIGTITSSRPGGQRLLGDTENDELDIRLLAVSPTARRRGVGRRLMAHIVRFANDNGLPKVYLKTGPGMKGAHHLYTSLGFSRDLRRSGPLQIDGKTYELFAFSYDVGQAHV